MILKIKLKYTFFNKCVVQVSQIFYGKKCTPSENQL